MTLVGSGIAAMDCIFAALAEQVGCDLVIEDDRLVKHLPGYPIISLDLI